MLEHLPSPSPLPDGFGLGEMTIGSAGTSQKIVVEPYPYGVTIFIRAMEGPNVGETVAQVPVKVGADTFKARLAPGAYLVFNKGWEDAGTQVTVRDGQYSRILVFAGLRH
jgi:hypothetical protein